jgi:hypothetical protein
VNRHVTYQLLIEVARPVRAHIGRFGKFAFPAGRYIYTGSAKRNFEARVARHLRREKALRWQAKNQWYGQPGFEEYTSYALGLHHKLVNSGVDPRTDQYFEQINARMHKTFPELFGGNGDNDHSRNGQESSKRPSTVVAPASRSSGTKKIQLTPRQIALAKKYGLTPQQYAAEVAKLEVSNG